MADDWELIVASFQTQYGIRLSQELDTMKWCEFSAFLNGLSGDTPLGKIIAIRAENDSEIVKKMSPEQKQIRAEWRRRQVAKKSDEEIRNMYAELQVAVMGMANGKG